jgi:3-carboxy-cis,cis-muconate cycloisomerase
VPDIPALAQRGAVAGTIALPVVNLLRGLVDEEARRYVHYGATSQDVIDTATMLQVRDGLQVLCTDLLGAGEACARLVQQHRRTVMAGRTLLQQAVPITFGLKAAGWVAGLDAGASDRAPLRRGNGRANHTGPPFSTAASLEQIAIRWNHLIA